MTSWRPEFSFESLYFITTSTYHHIRVLKDNVTKQILLDSFDCLRRKGHFLLFSFVVMPTHIHFISKIQKPFTLGDFMRDLKSLTANRIKRYLMSINNNKYPGIGKIWEDNYNAKEIYTTPFLIQKLDYIHQNPCKSPWNLADRPEIYPWSSARFYLTNQPCIIPIDNLWDYL